MKHLTEIFTLSKSEQRVIVIVVLALIAVALVRHQRSAQQLPLRPKTVATVTPSPNPYELRDEQ
jgi:hypothetical protein